MRIYVIMFVLFAACSAKHATKTEVMKNDMSDTTAIAVNDTLPLVVQFYSIGEGINPQSQVLLDIFIAAQSKKYSVSIRSVIVPWGREGEYDACFRLSLLNEQQKAALLKEVSQLFNESSRVHVLLNQPCKFAKQ
ncbi:MAG: hypothetical protein JNK61_04370 [Bacteroidia bacterium]|nr:hypothetical protein [Bacteroidia bacterium]